MGIEQLDAALLVELQPAPGQQVDPRAARRQHQGRAAPPTAGSETGGQTGGDGDRPSPVEGQDVVGGVALRTESGVRRGVDDLDLAVTPFGPVPPRLRAAIEEQAGRLAAHRGLGLRSVEISG